MNNIVYGNLLPYKNTREIAAKSGLNLDDHIVGISEFMDDVIAKLASPRAAIPMLGRWTEMQAEQERQRVEWLKQFEMHLRIKAAEQAEIAFLRKERMLLELLRELGVDDSKAKRFVSAIKASSERAGLTPDQCFEKVIEALETISPEKKSSESIPIKADRESIATAAIPTTEVERKSEAVSVSVPEPKLALPDTFSGITTTLHSGTIFVSSSVDPYAGSRVPVTSSGTATTFSKK
jgi:hypothetical protein